VAEPAPAPAEQLQQPTFALPVSTDRWAAARPDLPESVVAEQDVAGPVDAPSTSAPQTKPAQPEPVKAEPNGATPWPPIGASWPAPARPEAPWPLPDNDPLPASVVAAAAAEHGDRPESPLLAALWAESAQQVLDRGTVRVCMRCALPVSTQARFCRRCGAQQG
jgi:ribosomal protein L40E